MKIRGCVKTIFAGALTIGFLSLSAAMQDKAEETLKRLDASVPRQRQIELALSAAPAEVSSKATVYVLGPKGYEKVRDGANGFSCLVERAFKGTTETAVGPACFDAEGSRTLMLTYLRREQLRAQGNSEEEIKADIAKGFKEGRFKAPGPGFLYMMSNGNYFYDPKSNRGGIVPPHLMFYAPYKTAKDVGYESISFGMVPYLTEAGGPEALLVIGVEKSSPQAGSAGDSQHH